MNEFKTANELRLSVNKCNYVDVSPHIEMKKRLEKEKEDCRVTFEASLNAYKRLVKEKFQLLADDLSIVEGLSCRITSKGQSVYLRIEIGAKSILIYCTCWGKQTTLSDNSTRATYDIAPTFYIEHNNGMLSTFNTFEELVQDSEFNNLLKNIIL